MQIITTLAALDAVPDPYLRPILTRYRDLIELATIYIVQSGDTLQTLEAARGWPFAGFEFIHWHPGTGPDDGAYECVFVLSDYGEGQVLLVPQIPGIDPEVLTLCQQNVTH